MVELFTGTFFQFTAVPFITIIGGMSTTNYRDTLCVERLSIDVPPSFAEATRVAAERRGLTTAAYARTAIFERLLRDGGPVPAIPAAHLHRAPLPRKRGAA
jgi:hypothetical protein